MLDKLNQRLAELMEQGRVRNKIRSKLQQVQADLVAETAKEEALKAALEKEGADVEELSGLSLTALFYAIIGSKEEQLDKEKQEQLAAQIKYDECLATVQDLQQEQVQLQNSILGYDGLEEAFEATLAEKEAFLLSNGGAVAHQLNDLAGQLVRLQSREKEIQEAVQAGTEVLPIIQYIVESLEEARDWGSLDMFGGGLLASGLKHGKIEHAQKATHEVQQRLRQFNYELKDISNYELAPVDLKGLEVFADYFFDNLITDWVVQSKIEKSLDSALALKYRILLVLGSLRGTLERQQQQIKEVQHSRDKLIHHAEVER